MSKIFAPRETKMKMYTEPHNEGEEKKIKISWKDLSYTIKVKYSKDQLEEADHEEKYYDRELLKPQNGYVKSGEAMFIMGSSGAGKTTLLNAL